MYNDENIIFENGSVAKMAVIGALGITVFGGAGIKLYGVCTRLHLTLYVV